MPQPQPVVYVQQQAPPPGQGQRGLPVAYAQPSLAPLPGQPQGQAQVPAAGGYNPTFVAQQQAAYEQAQQRAMMTTDFDVVLREVHSGAADAAHEPDAVPSSLAADCVTLGTMPGDHDDLAAELDVADWL